MIHVHKSAAGKTPRKQAKRRPAPVATVTVHPDVMATARRLAAGRDVRLVVQPSGSVLVVNGARRGNGA